MTANDCFVSKLTTEHVFDATGYVCTAPSCKILITVPVRNRSALRSGVSNGVANSGVSNDTYLFLVTRQMIAALCSKNYMGKAIL